MNEPVKMPDQPGWYWAKFASGSHGETILRAVRVYALSSGDLWGEFALWGVVHDQPLGLLPSAKWWRMQEPEED